MGQKSDLKARIARARRVVAYADSCQKFSMVPGVSPELRAKMKADCDATRSDAKGVLRILLAELEQSK